MSDNGNIHRNDVSTIIGTFFDETFHKMFIIDEHGDTIVFQSLDEVIHKIILYENITSNRLYVRKSAVEYVYRQYGCLCNRICEFRATFGKRRSDGLVVIKSYNIHHTFN